MAKLKIIKLALKTWKHNSDVDGDFILSKFYAKQENNEFLIVERYGAKRRKYLISEIEVYDIGGGSETFTTFEDLFLRLEALNYTAFYQEGEVIFDPSAFDLADFSNSSANPFVSTTELNNGLATKEDVIELGTESQYFRGDKTFQTLDKTAVGLSDVENTSDADKPISNATQTALNSKFNIPTGTANRLAKFATANTIGDSQIFDNGTNVGIGTDAPSVPFEVKGQTLISAGASSGTTAPLIVRNTIPYQNPFNQFIQLWQSQNNIIMSLRSDGSVNFPNGGSVNTQTFRATTAGNGFSTWAFRFNNNGIWFPDENKIAFSTNATEKVRIDNLGNVGIGTATPAGVLDVVSTTRASLPFPRMTQTQRLAISTPAVGSMVYQTDGTAGLYIFKATVGWTFII